HRVSVRSPRAAHPSDLLWRPSHQPQERLAATVLRQQHRALHLACNTLVACDVHVVKTAFGFSGCRRSPSRSEPKPPTTPPRRRRGRHSPTPARRTRTRGPAQQLARPSTSASPPPIAIPSLPLRCPVPSADRPSAGARTRSRRLRRG